MTQIKPMMSFIKKEFLHIFRDWRTILILVLMPIAQILLFGFALSSDIKDVKYAIFNPANSEFSGKILSHLESSGYFKKDSIITDFNNIFTKNIDVAFIFPSDFSSQNPRMQILLDASDPNRASTINMQASSIFLNALLLESNMPKATKINLNTTMLFNPESKSALSFVPGLMGMLLMLICAMMTSISIVREKELGSMEILLTCPLKPIYVIISKIIPYFLLSCVILLLVLWLCVTILDIQIKGSLMLLLAFCLLYLSLALSIGLLVSNLAKSQIVAMLVCAMIFMSL